MTLSMCADSSTDIMKSPFFDTFFALFCCCTFAFFLHFCHVSPVTGHLSLLPIATVTDPHLLIPPLCTVDWFAKKQ